MYQLYLSSTNVSSSHNSFQLLEVLLELLVDLFKLNSEYAPEIAVHLGAKCNICCSLCYILVIVEGGCIQLVMDYKSKCDEQLRECCF